VILSSGHRATADGAAEPDRRVAAGAAMMRAGVRLRTPASDRRDVAAARLFDAVSLAGLARPIVVGNDLLVIADATAQIADLRYQAYLCNRCRVGARLWKHVADLSDLTFLRGVVEILAKHLACGIL
jgi:hypothetical protein